MERTISEATRKLLLKYQRDEASDHLLYLRLAQREKNGSNREILERIAADEKEHADAFAQYTGRRVEAAALKVWWYSFLSFLFGYTFIIKLMENGEHAAHRDYGRLTEEIPEMMRILQDEMDHEDRLAEMLDEDRLKYVGSMVLGLNDALVELSGAIAGLTLALADTRVVALAGIITGTSATLSMAASNYLAERAEGRRDALKSSLYTGTAYLITVVCLVTPYLVFPGEMYMAALATMLAMVIFIIFAFNYYISVAKSLPFGRRFWEMTVISLGVALISFGIGLAAKRILNVDL